MFLIESSMWGRLWLDKFTCRDKEKRSALKRLTTLDEARTIRTTGQFSVTCCCRTSKETSQDSICCSTFSNFTVGKDHRVEFTVHKHEPFFFGPCPRRPLLSTFSYTHGIFKDGKILYWCLYLHMVASSIKEGMKYYSLLTVEAGAAACFSQMKSTVKERERIF